MRAGDSERYSYKLVEGLQRRAAALGWESDSHVPIWTKDIMEMVIVALKYPQVQEQLGDK